MQPEKSLQFLECDDGPVRVSDGCSVQQRHADNVGNYLDLLHGVRGSFLLFSFVHLRI